MSPSSPSSPGTPKSADLSPQELRLLLAVAETGSFTAAAERLDLTQSAVSHAVRGAERRVGVVLFDRGRTGARPTPAGERALVHARQILRQLELLVDESRAAAGGSVSGTVRIAAFRSAAVNLLPPALEALAARHPGITPQVLIVRELGRGTAGEVADGRADLAIATLGEGAAPPPGLTAVELLQEPYFLVRPAGRSELDGLPLIDWAENCSSYTRSWWRTQDWLPSTRINVEDDGAILAMVAQGIGYAILPRLTMPAPPQPGVDVVPLGGRPPTRRLVAVTGPATARSTAVRELIRQLRRHAG